MTWMTGEFLTRQFFPVKTLRGMVHDRALLRWLIWGTLLGSILF